MSYDANEVSSTLERPAIIVRRGWLGRKWRRLLNLLPGISYTEREIETKTYTGRLLSDAEWRSFASAFVEAGPETTLAEQEELLRDLLIAMEIPPSVVLELPGAVQQAAIEDFLGCQVRAAGLDPAIVERSRSRPPHGTSSPSGTRTSQTRPPFAPLWRSPSSSTDTAPSSTGDGTDSPPSESGTPETE